MDGFLLEMSDLTQENGARGLKPGQEYYGTVW